MPSGAMHHKERCLPFIDINNRFFTFFVLVLLCFLVSKRMCTVWRVRNELF